MATLTKNDKAVSLKPFLVREDCMRKFQWSFYLLTFLCGILLSGCQRSSGSTWEDTKTLGRYIKRNTQKLLGQYNDSKMIYDHESFLGPVEDEYIPLNEKDSIKVKGQFTKLAGTQTDAPIPSAEEHHIPHIDSFKNPTDNLAQIFKTVHFHTDDHVLREQEYISVIDNIANYLKKNPKTYVFILGHCDERASEAYNLALGTRRSNHVRTLLVKKGLNPNHIFTISFGKELPIDSNHTKESWAKNRRVEFKIYEKTSTIMN